MAIGLIQAGQRITAALLNSIAPNCVIKGADQSVNNSTTLVNDTALTVPTVAGATYIFVCYLDYEGASVGTGDIKWTWGLPAGATLRYAAVYTDASGTAQLANSKTGSNTVPAGTSGSGNIRMALMVGSMTNAVASGSVTLQWAQNTANAVTSTIVHAQSFLALWRIS